MSTAQQQAKSKKRVLIIGAGAAGCSAAYALSRHPDQFDVHVFESADVPGGMATSEALKEAGQKAGPQSESKYGADWCNDGVQGGSPAFGNTLRIVEMLGFKTASVGMQISFGKGEEGFWSNVFPSKMSQEFSGDIKKFGKVLKIIKSLEPLFGAIPVHVMLKMFRFSPDFGDKMIYPLVALFFGTGQQTPYISSAILERVFLDPSMKLFEFDSGSLLASVPEMFAFPRLRDLYSAWQKEIESRQSVHFHLRREVKRIVSRKTGNVVVEYRELNSEAPEAPLTSDAFDELILACDADNCLKLLGKQASWMERRILGNVLYLHDVSITHNDLDYMRKHYEIDFPKNLAATKEQVDKPEEHDKTVEWAEKEWRPLYLIKVYEEDKKKIEMSFDLTHYQPQFRGESASGPVDAKDDKSSASDDTLPGPAEPSAKKPFPPLEDHVFQTIFLDRDGSEKLWTKGEIDPDKQLIEKWWKQQSHRWQHYVTVVPFMMFLNGKNHTQYAGAWSLLNMHELAVSSGFAAAYRLGASYPFADAGPECKRMFALYLGVSHGMRLRSKDRAGFFV